MALLISTATGLRSRGIGLKPQALGLQGQGPAPGEGVMEGGQLAVESSSAWVVCCSDRSGAHDSSISARAASSTVSLVVFSHLTSSSY